MRFQDGDLTVGDRVPITLTADITLTGKNINMILIKPSGGSLEKDTVISDADATYTTGADDLDEAGDWFAYLRNKTDHYDFRGGKRFRVHLKPEDMARAR